MLPTAGSATVKLKYVVPNLTMISRPISTSTDYFAMDDLEDLDIFGDKYHDNDQAHAAPTADVVQRNEFATAVRAIAPASQPLRRLATNAASGFSADTGNQHHDEYASSVGASGATPQYSTAIDANRVVLDAALPQSYRSTLPYATLNRVQSRVFDAVINTDKSIAVSVSSARARVTAWHRVLV